VAAHRLLPVQRRVQVQPLERPRRRVALAQHLPRLVLLPVLRPAAGARLRVRRPEDLQDHWSTGP
jgi:hypothetical protein